MNETQFKSIKRMETLPQTCTLVEYFRCELIYTLECAAHSWWFAFCNFYDRILRTEITISFPSVALSPPQWRGFGRTDLKISLIISLVEFCQDAIVNARELMQNPIP